MLYFAGYCLRHALVSAVLLGLCSACAEKEVALGVGDARVAGTWRLYQRSYGPDTNRRVTPVPAMSPQTITFAADGHLTTSGDSLNYYRNVKYYRVDSTGAGLQLRLIANVQELPGEPQGLRIRRDTLIILPYFSPTLQLAFVRAR